MSFVNLAFVYVCCCFILRGFFLSFFLCVDMLYFFSFLFSLFLTHFLFACLFFFCFVFLLFLITVPISAFSLFHIFLFILSNRYFQKYSSISSFAISLNMSLFIIFYSFLFIYFFRVNSFCFFLFSFFQISFFFFLLSFFSISFNVFFAQSAGAVEYTDCTSAEG